MTLYKEYAEWVHKRRVESPLTTYDDLLASLCGVRTTDVSDVMSELIAPAAASIIVKSPTDADLLAQMSRDMLLFGAWLARRNN